MVCVCFGVHGETTKNKEESKIVNGSVAARSNSTVKLDLAAM
jgi:hypothetical protein